MSAFDDYFAKMMPDVEKWAAQFAAEPVTSRPVVVPANEQAIPPEGGYLVPPAFWKQAAQNGEIAIEGARKIVTYAEIPDDLAMDPGIIPDTRPKPPPLPWRTRTRRKITATVADWRERAARRAYKIIAGEWPHDREDDW